MRGFAAAIAAMLVGTAPVPAIYEAEAPPQPAAWSREQAALGKKLFHEKRLSKDSTVACATCHVPSKAFTDGQRRAKGVGGAVGRRNTPTVANRALGKTQDWDGRAKSLEEQALGPIQDAKEMALPIAALVERLAADASYAAAFRKAFGGPPTPERVGQALAAYQRTVWSVDAPFDRFLAGDEQALSPAARRGLELFGGKAHCGDCHAGPSFTDEDFHALGVAGDDGRFEVTKAAKDRNAYKTPTLREIARTAPYMHDGSIATLAEVVEYYDRGAEPHPNLDPKLKKLGLTATEKAELVAFLEALSGQVVDFEGPVRGD